MQSTAFIISGIHREGVIKHLSVLMLLILLSNCSSDQSSQKKETTTTMPKMEQGTFGYDVQFLKKYTDVVILEGEDTPGSVLVTPVMQGRIMTSTVAGDSGKSLGWVNHALIASGEEKEHFTPYGGEGRFWLGPEGGQYSIFIEPGTEMVFENWYVPSGFNTEPWTLVAKSDSQVQVKKKLHLTNYSKTPFDILVNRTINFIDKSAIEDQLTIEIPQEVRYVAFGSENIIKNIGEKAWTKETGTVSIWILGMFTPAPGITVVVPFKEGSVEELGPIVNTKYFGEISPERIQIEEGVIYFKVDGKKRRKLGVSPERALSVAGSYDETNQLLTIIQFSLPEDATDYMNQLWKQQEHPYEGEVVFAYNDGPLEDGSQLGPFYEMESASPAAFLKPGETQTHHHRVYHFKGNEQALNNIAESVLGVGIQEIKSAF